MPNLALGQKTPDTRVFLSKNIILRDKLPPKISTVSGVDVSYVSEFGVGAITVLDHNLLELLETQVAVVPVRIPCVPTFLSFRELPPAIAAIRKLTL